MRQVGSRQQQLHVHMASDLGNTLQESLRLQWHASCKAACRVSTVLACSVLRMPCMCHVC